MMRRISMGWAAMAVGSAAFALPASGQRPTLTPDDYDQWERLGAFELDPTGQWLVASVTHSGSTELRVHAADGSGEPIVLEHGRSPEFTRDGRWLVYLKGISEEEREESDEPAPDRLGLVNLTTSHDSVYFDVGSFALREDGMWLAARGVPASDSVGADLILMNPSSGAQTLIGNVEHFAWQDEGPLLAATQRTAWGGANAVILFDSDESTLRTLTSGGGEYSAPSWREGSFQLAVMRSGGADEEASHDIMVWENARADDPLVLHVNDRADIPPDLRITPYMGVRFSDDGRRLFVGVRPVPAADDAEVAPDVQNPGKDEGGSAEAEDDEEEGEAIDPADVQVWHWDDHQILRAQEYGAERIARRTMTAAWLLDTDRFVILGDDLDEPVTILAGGRWGIVPDYGPYLFDRRFGASTADWYRVDVSTGERAPLADRVEFGVHSRFESEHVLIYRDDHWTTVAVGTLRSAPIGEGTSFTRPLTDYDYPGPRPSWGMGGWLEDGAGALLYDEHDVWMAGLDDGSLRRLTDGASTGRRYRVVDVDPSGSPFTPPVLEPGEELWLSVTDRRTKASGYASLAQGGEPHVRLFEDARVTGLTQAEGTDRYALRMERWDDSPDVFVGGTALDTLRQVTRTNTFQADFAWGRAELLEYTTDAGHDLQAVLVYPAGFRQGERYPLILYQYERLSDNLHVYDVPSERDYYNYQAWSQEGYFVLMPDIVYEPGRPGPSALDAVEHALDAAVATGHVDAERMGLIGHSWGGYQASYLPTRTNRFAASVAGAAITNFLSFMGAVHWNGGLPETGHWETGQARMVVPYWENLEGHLESSPANFITDLATPILLMHGDSDGVVDFYQGLEFYNYARRAGKEVVLLVYPGADHGLSDESHQVDYHRRILEWFGHYLKGEPAPAWIARGESWPERERRIGR